MCNKDRLYMEDISKIALDATDFIVKALAEAGITVQEAKGDEILSSVLNVLDEFASDYRHYN